MVNSKYILRKDICLFVKVTEKGVCFFVKKTKKQTLFYIEVWKYGKNCEKKYKNGGKIMQKHNMQLKMHVM